MQNLRHCFEFLNFFIKKCSHIDVWSGFYLSFGKKVICLQVKNKTELVILIKQKVTNKQSITGVKFDPLSLNRGNVTPCGWNNLSGALLVPIDQSMALVWFCSFPWMLFYVKHVTVFKKFIFNIICRKNIIS